MQLGGRLVLDSGLFYNHETDLLAHLLGLAVAYPEPARLVVQTV